MINRRTTICIKVSPSPDIEFIVSGLARIAKDNQMVIEVWLDGPRGGTGAAPDIIKGQMGMHMEYAIPICHEKLMGDGLRDHVVFMGSGGFRTWGDIVKGMAMGLDGVILGTADLVAIGCVRDRNCESGCRSGISTIEPRMQLLRDVELNMQQIINFRATLQAQITRAIAALGMKDIRELRGRYDAFTWPLMEARVEDHRRRRAEVLECGPLRKTRDGSRPSGREPCRSASGEVPFGLRCGGHCLQPLHPESCHGSHARPDGQPGHGRRRHLEGRLLQPPHGPLCLPCPGQGNAPVSKWNRN